MMFVVMSYVFYMFLPRHSLPLAGRLGRYREYSA